MPNSNRQDIKDRTFAFGVRIIKLLDRLPHTLAAAEIGKQLLRAATSVGANMEEADVAESHKDFVHKVGIARKEAQEARFWLRNINAAIQENDPEVLALIDEADQLARILYRIIHPKK